MQHSLTASTVVSLIAITRLAFAFSVRLDGEFRTVMRDTCVRKHVVEVVP